MTTLTTAFTANTYLKLFTNIIHHAVTLHKWHVPIKLLPEILARLKVKSDIGIRTVVIPRDECCGFP